MLGIVSDKRQGLGETVSEKKLFKDYKRTTLVDESEAVEQVAKLIKKKPGVLVCMEAHHKNCHRSYLAEIVADVSGLPIKHVKAIVR